MEICEKRSCAGCFACYNICPKHCIHMEADELGNIHPVIDESQCIHCGSCRRVCFNNHELAFRKPMLVYAAWVKDSKKRNESASGGIGTALMEEVINRGGVAFGASNDDGIHVHHKMVDSVSDLSTLKNSKYVHSFVENTFREARIALRQKKQVIYTGTPCQIAGLYGFLGRDLPNLMTVDIVCHGVPSQKDLREHINRIVQEKGISENYTISFRHNNQFGLTLKGVKGKILYTKTFKEDLYMRCFMATEIFRSSCYDCKFAHPNRISDLTICDFWGIRVTPEIEGEIGKGISCILVNTEKGKRLLDSIKERLVVQERSLEEAVNGNTQLRHPSPFSNKAQMIREGILAGKNFDEAAYDAHKSEIRKENIKRAIKAFDNNLPVPFIVSMYKSLKGKK